MTVKPALTILVCVALGQAVVAAPPPRPTSATQPPATQNASPRAETRPATNPAATRPVIDFLSEGVQTPGGFAGGRINAGPSGTRTTTGEALPVPDRWRLTWPAWDRYGRQGANDPLLMNHAGGDSPYTRGDPLNSYDRNVFKGDYPVFTTPGGDDVFVNLTGVSDTLVNYRRLPTPSGVSAEEPGSFDFFGDGEQLAVSQTFLVSAEVFQGYTAFRPVDWLIRVTPAANVNCVELEERNNVDVDVRDGVDRDDAFATLQEAFLEYHLGDVSPTYDIVATRLGRQLFVSDFRGFIFSDVADGVRLFGNLASNRVQYNMAFFNENDKDTNSGLSELRWREQQVTIANLFVQDFVWPGYTAQGSFHWNHDESDPEYDDNGFLVIPDPVGSVTPHKLDAFYLGWAGDGHIGRLNVNHAFYYVLGRDKDNPLAGRDVDLDAYMGALELSVDIDWWRPKLSFLYASGDRDPLDGKGGGFDGIVDNPFFAGGPSSFYQSQALRVFGVNLVSARSFYNDLATAKGEGQSNFVNPGTILMGAGVDAELTPKLRASLNVNSIWLAETESLEFLLNQNGIDQHLGEEVNLAIQFRPFLNNNIIFTLGGSVFEPGEGFNDVFGKDEMLYQVFTGLTLTY